MPNTPSYFLLPPRTLGANQWDPSRRSGGLPTFHHLQPEGTFPHPEPRAGGCESHPASCPLRGHKSACTNVGRHRLRENNLCINKQDYMCSVPLRLPEKAVPLEALRSVQGLKGKNVRGFSGLEEGDIGHKTGGHQPAWLEYPQRL